VFPTANPFVPTSVGNTTSLGIGGVGVRGILGGLPLSTFKELAGSNVDLFSAEFVESLEEDKLCRSKVRGEKIRVADNSATEKWPKCFMQIPPVTQSPRLRRPPVCRPPLAVLYPSPFLLPNRFSEDTMNKQELPRADVMQAIGTQTDDLEAIPLNRITAEQLQAYAQDTRSEINVNDERRCAKSPR
jgi:hypothetical protein